MVPGVESGLIGNGVRILNCPAAVSSIKLFFIQIATVLLKDGKAEEQGASQKTCHDGNIHSFRGLKLLNVETHPGLSI